MHPILTISKPFPFVESLIVYPAFEQDGDVIYPMEMNNDIFMIKWNSIDKWHCYGIEDNEMINAIGHLIEKKKLFMLP